MSVIRAKSQAVLNEVGQVGIDIDDAIGIIETLIGIFKNCRKVSPEKATRQMNRFGPILQDRAEQAVKDRFGKKNPKFVEGVRKIAKGITVPDVQAMYGEVGSKTARLASDDKPDACAAE